MMRLVMKDLNSELVQVPPFDKIETLLDCYESGNYGATENLANAIAKEFPDHSVAWKVLGVMFKREGRLLDALVANQKVVWIEPQEPNGYFNLGNNLNDLGRFEDAAESYIKAISLNKDRPDPDFFFNLGNTFKRLGRLEEAAENYQKTIALTSAFSNAEAHFNLGITLQQLGRFENSETSYRQAIAIKPDYASAHNNLGIILYGEGKVEDAFESLETANHLNPDLKEYHLLSAILKTEKEIKKSKTKGDDKNGLERYSCLKENPLILNREVEENLISKLYELNSIDLNEADDPSFGNSRGSYDLFENNSPVVQKMAGDFKQLLMEAVGSEIFIYDSFFSIFGAGGGTVRHHHLSQIDQDPRSNLGNKKYSVVYYLSTGDQNCSEPGILKFYDPSEDVLPSKGMITIFPASRHHSSVYGGKTARVIVGINFYSL